MNDLKRYKDAEDAILSKYNYDKKFLHLHNKIKEHTIKTRDGQIIFKDNLDLGIHSLLMAIKKALDESIANRNDLKNKEYFTGIVQQVVLQQFKNAGYSLSRDDRQ
ncbi:UNVERIFIED_CONTAM: hypothetical protein O8I53_10480 [Campylobacter lari]